mmetsp:Transcript_52982/g.78546  ORF Transcript_52982/g.78546 Transcript_52982/m.78546 type:complete len:166 (-) Transcript_52982:173-670(-)
MVIHGLLTAMEVGIALLVAHGLKVEVSTPDMDINVGSVHHQIRRPAVLLKNQKRSLCRQESGGYQQMSSKTLSNSDWCRDKCCKTNWCLAVEFTSLQSECHLVTDVETFEGAGYTLQSTAWGADQIIDGDTWTTYCNGGGDCTAGSTRFGGGSLNPRSGYQCWIG